MTWNWVAVVAGVGFGENDHVGIVGGCVETNCEPKTAGAPQGKAPEDSIQRDTHGINPVLVRLEDQVDQAKNRSKKDRRRPESNAFGERLESISAKEELFAKSQSEHGDRPRNRVENELPAVKGQAVKAASASKINGDENCGGRNKSPDCALQHELCGLIHRAGSIPYNKHVTGTSTSEVQ